MARSVGISDIPARPFAISPLLSRTIRFGKRNALCRHRRKRVLGATRLGYAPADRRASGPGCFGADHRRPLCHDEQHGRRCFREGEKRRGRRRTPQGELHDGPVCGRLPACRAVGAARGCCEVLSNAGVVQCRVLAITCAMGLLFAPGANAEPGVAPIPRQPSSSCDPNYSGACVPIASDVDCAGGSGNGPAYVEGPVIVIGRDIYGLDRDGNGIGCE